VTSKRNFLILVFADITISMLTRIKILYLNASVMEDSLWGKSGLTSQLPKQENILLLFLRKTKGVQSIHNITIAVFSLLYVTVNIMY